MVRSGGRPACGPSRRRTHLRLLLRGEAVAGAERLPELEVVHRDAVLEDARVDEVPQRLGQVTRLPFLSLVDAQDAVAEVVVLAQDVGVDVVAVVVGAPPLKTEKVR